MPRLCNLHFQIFFGDITDFTQHHSEFIFYFFSDHHLSEDGFVQPPMFFLIVFVEKNVKWFAAQSVLLGRGHTHDSEVNSLTFFWGKTLGGLEE